MTRANDQGLFLGGQRTSGAEVRDANGSSNVSSGSEVMLIECSDCLSDGVEHSQVVPWTGRIGQDVGGQCR
jgi:hypothetical protein